MAGIDIVRLSHRRIPFANELAALLRVDGNHRRRPDRHYHQNTIRAVCSHIYEYMAAVHIPQVLIPSLEVSTNTAQTMNVEPLAIVLHASLVRSRLSGVTIGAWGAAGGAEMKFNG